MEKFEPGSFLKPTDYSERSHVGLIVACGIAAILFVIVFIVPLLN